MMILKIRKSYALVTSIVISSRKLKHLSGNKKIFELTEEYHEPTRITSNSQKHIDLVFSKLYLQLIDYYK